ncbi:MAG: complex I NDUFA9 subunit family protein [Janthinobacterium lividum]
MPDMPAMPAANLHTTLLYPSVLVIGGTGFIGSHLVARLVRGGYKVIVPTRRLASGRHLLVLPGLTLLQADVHDDAVLLGLVKRADAVINLVGVLHSRPGKHGSAFGPAFARAHVDLPRRVVVACAKAGVKRYLHMSALGAAADGPSMYLRSKAAGEAAARADRKLAVTVFQPAVLFGEDDQFLNMFARLQKFLPVMMLGGSGAAMQPVYVGDVTLAFERALADPSTAAMTYELAGPNIYTLGHLVRLAGLYSGHLRPLIGLPAAPARVMAWLMEFQPGGPLMSRDNLDSLKKPNVAAALPDARVMPQQTALEAVAPFYLGGNGRRRGTVTRPTSML